MSEYHEIKVIEVTKNELIDTIYLQCWTVIHSTLTMWRKITN